MILIARKILEFLKQVMRKGALDPITKELIYVAVSITNSCEYCTKSHSFAAKRKDSTKC